jgi:MFS family permease
MENERHDGEKSVEVREKTKQEVTKSGTAAAAAYYTKLSIALVLGWTFAGLLTGAISIICGAIAGESGYKPKYLAGPYTALVASLLAFGVIYLVLAFQVKNKKYEAHTNSMATKVLSLCFMGGQLVPTIGYAIAFFAPIVSLVLGFGGVDTASLISQLVSAFLGLLISGLLIFYHIKTVVKISRGVYVGIMAVLFVLVVALFSIFPARLVREAIDKGGSSSCCSSYCDDYDSYRNALDCVRY